MAASIYCFKNGFSLLNKRYTVEANASELLIGELPASHPTHGSVWVEGANVARVETCTLTSVQSRPAITLHEMLVANCTTGSATGPRVKLLLRRRGDTTDKHGDVQWVKGTISIPGNTGVYSSDTFNAGSVLVVTTEAERVIVPVSSVLLISSDDADMVTDVNVSTERKGLRVVLDQQPVQTELNLRLISPGVTWAPSFKLDLLEDGKLQVVAHACLINDAISVPEGHFDSVNFIAGVPSLQFSSTVDPLAQQQTCQAFLRSLGASGAPPLSSVQDNVMSNFVSQRVVVNSSSSSAYSASAAANAGDLHVYSYPGFCCAKGERVRIAMFPAAVVDYTDMHEASVSMGVRSGSPEPSAVDVYHYVKFRNRTSVPWTTSPALIVRGAALVCQSEITYTPVNADVQVKLTKALGVRVIHSETTTRTKERTSVLNHSYLKCQVEGRFDLQNFKSSEVTLSLKANIVGQLEESSTSPKETKPSSSASARADLANDATSALWECKLDSGGSQTITYKRSYWIRG